MLLCAVTTMWAGPTDLPQITTDLENPIYYTIVNTRSHEPGGYMYFAGENIGLKDEQVAKIEAKHKFYFTGSHDALYVHNAATDLKLASVGSWTAEGAAWAVGVSPKGTGLAFGPKGGLNGNSCWNEKNYSTDANTSDFTTWSANDDGSIFLVALAEDCEININDFYTIEAPLFENVQGVKKGLVVNEDGSLGWNTVDLTNKNHYWVPTQVNGTTVALKNVGTEKYLNGTGVSTEYVASTVKVLGLGQYNIVSNGTTVHANNHGGGGNASGNIVSWGGSVGSASAWQFVEQQDPDAVQAIEITYNFTYNGQLLEEYEQTVTTVTGAEYPNVTVQFPFGISAIKPEGTIAKEDAPKKIVTIAVEENLPFEYVASFDEIKSWYYLKIKGANYLYHTDSLEYIDLSKVAVDDNNKKAFSWAFIGNPFNGYQIVNMATGNGYILSSSTTTTDGNTGGNTYPVMTATPVASNNNELWVLSNSTYTENGFYIEQKGHSANKMNNRGSKLAYWNTGADSGSTFNVELRPSSTDELIALVEHARTLLSQITIGDAPGEYSSSYEGYEAVYAEIIAYVEAGDIKELVAADYVIKLTAIINSFTLNMPKPGNYYRIAYNYQGTVKYAQGVASGAQNKENGLLMSEEKGAASIFYFDDGKLLSYTAGTYVKEDGGVRGLQAVGTAGTVSFEAGSAIGTIAIKAPNYMHANSNNGTDFIDHCGGAGHNAHNFIIEEVKSLPVTISAAGYATFYAPVAVEATGVKAYTVSVNEGGWVDLTEIEGGVIPANTGVVLEAAEGTYNFAITAADATVKTDLEGTVAATYITDDAYILGYVVKDNGEKEVGFGTANKNLQNDTAWKNNSHKAYLPKPANNDAASYSFRFDRGTTGINELKGENGEVKTIYDLTGRKIEAISAPGIYIVNGKKTLVK